MSKCHPCHRPVPTWSPAPAQDVARRILGEDVTQTDFYAAPMGLTSSGLWPMRRSAQR